MEPWYWLSQILFLHLCQRLWDSWIVPQFLEAGCSKPVQSTPKVPWRSWKFKKLSLTRVAVKAFCIIAQQLAHDFLKKSKRELSSYTLGAHSPSHPLSRRSPSHPAVRCTNCLPPWEAGGAAPLMKMSSNARRKLNIYYAREKAGHALQSSALDIFLSCGDSWVRVSSSKPAGILSVHSCRVVGT